MLLLLVSFLYKCVYFVSIVCSLYHVLYYEVLTSDGLGRIEVRPHNLYQLHFQT